MKNGVSLKTIPIHIGFNAKIKCDKIGKIY